MANLKLSSKTICKVSARLFMTPSAHYSLVWNGCGSATSLKLSTKPFKAVALISALFSATPSALWSFSCFVRPAGGLIIGDVGFFTSVMKIEMITVHYLFEKVFRCAACCRTCSAPGKVLIVGGYAVLEHPNPGLVLAVSARFYSSYVSLLCVFRPRLFTGLWQLLS